jgi:hypothetical protein
VYITIEGHGIPKPPKTEPLFKETRQYFTVGDVGDLVTMRLSGDSYSAIAAKLGWSKTTIVRWAKNIRESV